MNTAKFIPAIVAAAVLATGIAVYQYNRAAAAETALLAAQAERSLLVTQLGAATQRAQEIEKDNDQLLKSLEKARSADNDSARRAVAKTSPEATERLAIERAFQRDLAARRAAAARRKAEIDTRIGSLSPVEKHVQLLAIAAELRDEGNSADAIRYYNEAIAAKPRETELSADAKELLASLRTQNLPVEVSITVANHTFAMIPGYRILAGGENRLSLLPGNYEIIGMRDAFKDVRIPIHVRGETAFTPLTIACTVPADRP